MNEFKNKDAHLKKILAELGMSKDKPLTPEQEEEFRYATDPDFKFQTDLERIFSKPPEEQ